MNIIQLTRHLDNRLYVKAIKAAIEKDLGSSLISVHPYSAKAIERAVSDKAKILGANAYEFCGAKLSDWSGEYSGSYSFYRINKEAIRIERERISQQMQFDFA